MDDDLDGRNGGNGFEVDGEQSPDDVSTQAQNVPTAWIGSLHGASL